MSKFPARTVNSYGNCQHIRLSNVSIFSPLEDSHLAFGFAGCSPEWGSAALLGSPFPACPRNPPKAIIWGS